VVVVTRGAHGALLVDGERQVAFPVRPVQVVDATGAGDTFSGVLAAWLADGRTLAEAVEAANAAAALSVTQRGAREGMPSRPAIEAVLHG
jgi:ribokinase